MLTDPRQTLGFFVGFWLALEVLLPLVTGRF